MEPRLNLRFLQYTVDCLSVTATYM